MTIKELLSKELTRGRAGFLSGLTLFGLAIILVGAVLPNSKVSSCVVAVGGAVAGAGLGVVFGFLVTENLASDMRDTMRRSLAPGFVSDEDVAAIARKKWHLYYVTQMRGKFVWRYYVVDLGATCVVGKLLSSHIVSGLNDEPHQYAIEGGIRNGRLVLFAKAPTGTEPSGVYLLPFFGQEFLSVHSGLLVNQTWDKTHCISPCMLSIKPLVGQTAEGSVSDDHADVLDTEWRNTIGHILFPRAITKVPPKSK